MIGIYNPYPDGRRSKLGPPKKDIANKEFIHFKKFFNIKKKNYELHVVPKFYIRSCEGIWIKIPRLCRVCKCINSLNRLMTLLQLQNGLVWFLSCSVWQNLCFKWKYLTCKKYFLSMASVFVCLSVGRCSNLCTLYHRTFPMECIASTICLQEYTNELDYIIVFEEKSRSAYFQKVTLFKT